MENKYSFQEIDNEIRDSFLRISQVFDERNKLRDNWNSLREWLKNKIDKFQDDVSEPILHEQMTMRVIYEYIENLDKMNELESGEKN